MDDSITTQLDALFAPYNRSNEPGCTVAIARDGRPLYRRAFGMACLEQGIANQLSTQMPVGSVAKQFTCAALLHLEMEGCLSRHDRVGRWLPELPEAQRTPTLIQLMRHEGGARCYLDQWMFNGYRTLPAGMAWTIQQRQQALNFTPGSRSAYSNGGYLLLSMVIERASGLAFTEFVSRRLLEPAGMHASSFPATRTTATHDLATAYLPERATAGWSVAPTMTEDALGDGGLIATADDLIRWADFLRRSNGAVSLDTLQAPAEPWAPGPSDYRLGLIAQRWRGSRLVQHGGGLPGANSSLVMLPDHGIDLAILFNRSAPATTLALRALEVVLGNALEASPAPPTVADYTGLVGSYFAPNDGLLFGFADEGGRLALTLFGDGPIALETCAAADADLPFWADVGAAQMRFRRGFAPGGIDYFDGKAWSKAERLSTAPSHVHTIEAAAEAEFASAEAAATIRISARDDALLVRVRGEIGNGDYRAEAIAPDLIRFWPSLFPAGKIARLIRSGATVSAIVVSTSRTRAITFTRADAPSAWSNK